MNLVPIEFTQGESVVVTLDLLDELDQPLPITNTVFDAAIRSFGDLDTVVASFTCTPDVANSRVTLSLTPAESMVVPHTVQYTSKGTPSSTPAELLFYDCFKTEPGGYRKAILAGQVTVNAAMSRLA